MALRPEPTGILSEARDHTVALYDEARFYTVLGPARQPRHPALFTGIARKALGGLVNTPKGGAPRPAEGILSTMRLRVVLEAFRADPADTPFSLLGR